MYVLDQSVATPGIRGYRIQAGGMLAPIGNQTLPISTPIGVPGTVIFTNDGEGLVVTNKIVSNLSASIPVIWPLLTPPDIREALLTITV